MAPHSGGMPPNAASLAAGLLVCCVATSAVTAMVVHLYLHAVHAGTVDDTKPSPPASLADAPTPTPSQCEKKDDASEAEPAAPAAPSEPEAVEDIPVEVPAPTTLPVKLQELSAELVPPALRLEAYFAPEHLQVFEHAQVFDGCANILAVLDTIHPYLDKFFLENGWMHAMSAENAQIRTLQSSTPTDSDGRCADDDNDEDEDDEITRRSSLHSRSSSFTHIRARWRLPKWLDPHEHAEIMIYPGVDPQTFAPDKIINIDTTPPRSEKGHKRSASVGSVGPGSQTSVWSRRPSYYRSATTQEAKDELPKRRLIISPGAHVLGGTFDVSEGSIHIGKHVRVEPNVFIKGPAIIGAKSTLRSGTYIRGDVIIGRKVVLRGELKNAVILDGAELCHPGYCGDSVCGFKSHFGNQVTTANLSLFINTAAAANLTVQVDDVVYDTGRKKIGVVLGDWSQLGCSAVTDPCTLLREHTTVYPLTRLSKGIYGPSALVKNKPMEKGVLEIVAMRESTSKD